MCSVSYSVNKLSISVCLVSWTLQVNRPIRLTMFFGPVATQFPTLDYSHGGIPLFWFAEEYVRTKVTRHTSDEYELFTHVHTSKCVVTFVLRYAAAS